MSEGILINRGNNSLVFRMDPCYVLKTIYHSNSDHAPECKDLQNEFEILS